MSNTAIIITPTIKLNELTANVSGAVLYYASRFCNPSKTLKTPCCGICLSPHASGTGVIAVALNGYSMGVFYDEAGAVNGTCSIEFDSSFIKSVKPTPNKKTPMHDVRVALENGQAVYTTAKGMTLSNAINEPIDRFPNIDNIISYMDRTSDCHIDTLTLNLKDKDLFSFPEYEQGTNVFITQYKNKIKNDKGDIFGNFFYVVRNMGSLPFQFFGVTIPVKAHADTLAAGYGIPEWYCGVSNRAGNTSGGSGNKD